LDFVVCAENLVKEYSGKRAVNKINFNVRRRECFGLLGPNGAGKSSTVKMIYCFSEVTDGHLMVLGMDVGKNPRQIKKRLGVVPQENNLDPDLSVIDNLFVYAGFFGISAEKAAGRAEELLNFFGLHGQKHDKVDSLSGGMKRRLMIARALINSPEILILDEPTTGLDPKARHLVWQRLRRLREQDVTLILTTHYMDEAAQLCDRLVIIDNGNILEEGIPHELVKKHIGGEVLEIGKGAEILGEIIEAGGENAKRYDLIGNSLFLYPLDGQELMDSLRPLLRKFSHVMLRQATLEDVFLKLTGRGLEE